MNVETIFTFTFSHLADAFIQSDLQMRTTEAIKTNKRAMICKCYDKSQPKVTFIYIMLLTIQIVSKQLSNIKIGK